jgi:hypothetical protein
MKLTVQITKHNTWCLQANNVVLLAEQNGNTLEKSKQERKLNATTFLQTRAKNLWSQVVWESRAVRFVPSSDCEITESYA